jgi:hypothetical protein
MDVVCVLWPQRLRRIAWVALPLATLVACSQSPRNSSGQPNPFTTDTAISRAELLAQIQTRLDQLKHIRREPSSPGAPDDVPETLAAAQGRLSQQDLLNIRLLLIGLAKPEATAEVLRLGIEDRNDTTTEHGGILDVDDAGQLNLLVLPPMLALSDREYVASDRAMALAPSHLALFHFHFSRIDSAENAGPGMGDLQFAARTRLTCVVFTSLSDRSFDADYYTPLGAVVDLGIYTMGN